MRLGFLVLLGLVGATPAFADDAVRTGAAAFGDWRTDAPGARRLITPADLPAPFATRSTANMSHHEAWTEADVPKAPPGFAVDLFATGLNMPRVIRVAPNGDIFVAETGAGSVRVFHPGASAGPAQRRDLRRRLAAAIRDRLLPVRIRSEVCLCRVAGLRCALSLSQRRHEGLRPRGKDRELAERWRTLDPRPRVLADDKTLYVSVGSGSNVDEGVPRADQASIAEAPIGASFGDEARRADVLAFDPDGRHERVYATGIRNCSGLAVQPGTGALWCAVNERDGLGDDLPPDYATHVAQGAFYGWPWYYLGDHQDPRHKDERADLANAITTPDVLIQAHSAPLGIAFYGGGSVSLRL